MRARGAFCAGMAFAARCGYEDRGCELWRLQRPRARTLAIYMTYKKTERQSSAKPRKRCQCGPAWGAFRLRVGVRGGAPAGGSRFASRLRSAFSMLDNRAYVNQRRRSRPRLAQLARADAQIALHSVWDAWQRAPKGAAFEDDAPVAGFDALQHVDAIESPPTAAPQHAEAHSPV